MQHVPGDTGPWHSDSFGLKTPEGLLGKMPFLIFKPRREQLSSTETNPELPTAENSTETSFSQGRDTQITQRGAGLEAHASCTAPAIPHRLKITLKK